MKSPIVATSLLVALVLAVAVAVAAPKPMKRSRVTPSAIAGAWELVWPARGEQRRQVKLITANRFSWSTYDTQTHKVSGSAGGTCTLVGDKYCEQLDFVLGGMESHAGQVLCFRLEVHGDTLVQIGSGDGRYDETSREVWRRLR